MTSPADRSRRDGPTSGPRMAEPIVTSELHFYRLSDKAARDVLRRAAADAKHGPVWLINKAGDRIGAVVTPDDVETLTATVGPGDVTA